MLIARKLVVVIALAQCSTAGIAMVVWSAIAFQKQSSTTG
jgi:hypothetical protein